MQMAQAYVAVTLKVWAMWVVGVVGEVGVAVVPASLIAVQVGFFLSLAQVGGVF